MILSSVIRRWATFSCVALLPLTAHAGSLRAPVDVSVAPWRALGRVQTELGTRCTGFLIAPRIVLTAAHCLFQHRTLGYVQPSSVHFLWGYADGAYRDHARVSAFAIAPGYDPMREGQTLGLDRAFLTLDHALGRMSDSAPLAPELPAIGTALVLGGYDRDHPEILMGDTCHLAGFGRDGGGHRLLVHDCYGEPGSSGAALFAQAPDGHWAAVGIEVAVTGPGGMTGLAEPLAP